MSTIAGWALWIAQILFFLFGVFILVEAISRDRRVRHFVGAAGYLAAAFGSRYLDAWWPLLVGFALLWVLKAFGLDQSDTTGAYYVRRKRDDLS